jgi:hypothetical protein
VGGQTHKCPGFIRIAPVYVVGITGAVCAAIELNAGRAPARRSGFRPDER